jgi:hypothetical protein
MKCAHFSTNIYHEFDYFEIPSIMLSDITETKQAQFNKEKINRRLDEEFKIKEAKKRNGSFDYNTPILIS